jgi:hypothetical protein
MTANPKPLPDITRADASVVLVGDWWIQAIPALLEYRQTFLAL